MSVMSAIPAQHRARLSAGAIYALGVLTTAAIGGPIGYHFVTLSNTKMVLQQQKLGDVQQFETTGGQLDNAVRGFSDALVDGKGIEASRNALRAAIGSHSAVAFQMRDAIGQADYGSYMEALTGLRGKADHAKTYADGVQVWQSAVALIENRRHLADRMRKAAAA